jgi:glutamate racemase
VRLVGPQVRILETGEPVARRARQLLQETQRLRSSPQAGRLTLQSSGDLPTLQAAAQRWLDGPQVA